MHFHKLLTIRIDHSYFEEGISPDFELLPSQDTSTLLRSNKILMRKDRNQFNFYAESSEQDSFDMVVELAGLGLLQFHLVNNDPLFTTYTSEIPINNHGIFHIRNNSDTHLLDMEFGPVNREIRVNEVGVLMLDMDIVIDQNEPELILVLSFTSREPLWEYQFVIPESRNMEVSRMRIEGIGNENYVGPVEGTLMETQKTLVMTTDRPVALSQNLHKYPILKLNYIDTVTNVSKELELKLPNPSPESIRTVSRDGVLTPFLVTSIIYV